ncbi:MAG: hypothetical protein MUC40_00650 [Akkermansiaceae bacterium]|jgi:hypothetical protein|nr:hypothetical protein [Akkermansiaceae bacterium]
MANVLSTVAALEAVALVKGPHRGSSALPTHLRILDDKASVPVGAPAVTSAQYIRFGRIPAGSKIAPNLSVLSTDHTAAIAGKLQLVPIDGIGTTQEITGVTVLLEDTAVSGNAETPDITSIPDVADSLVVAKDSWIQFVPTSDLTIASTAKAIRARIVYGSVN